MPNYLQILLAIAALWVGRQLWLYLRRRPVTRITPQQLRARLDRGDAVVLIDLRKWQDVLSSGEKLPRALVRTADELFRDRVDGRVPGELILYCS